MNNNTEIIEFATVKEMTEQWTVLQARLRAALGELVALEKDMEPMFGRLYLEGAIRHHGGLTDADRVLQHLELQGWGHILGKLGVWEFLSMARANTLRQQLEGKGPSLGPLTLDNVSQTMASLHNQIETFAEEAVLEVYRILRPMTHHKTNSPWELKEKIILEHTVEVQDKRWPESWRPRVGYGYARDKVGAIDRVFHLLDGRGYVSKTSGGELGTAIEKSTAADPTGETHYFKFKAFKNGNLHLTIKNTELIFRFNQIAGKQFLAKGDAA